VIQFDIQQETMSKLTELQRALGVPVRDIASALARAIRYRVQLKGQRPDGRHWTLLGTYAVGDRTNDPKMRWWVRPDSPQPLGYIRQIPSGEFAGWAVYENFAVYMRALSPKQRQRRWERTGELWRTLGVRLLSAARAKVTFMGRRKTSPRSKMTLANAQVAYLAGRFEGVNVLMPSPEEVRSVLEAVQNAMETSWGDVLRAAGETVPRSKKRPSAFILTRERVPSQTI
jgi:hypothetical protein